MWEKCCRAGKATDDNMALARIACWIPKAKNTHSQYVILTAFPQQLLLQEHASTLLYTYIACRVCINSRSIVSKKRKYNFDKRYITACIKVLCFCPLMQTVLSVHRILEL